MPTRTTVALGVLLVAYAAYAACVLALEASMYGELIERPYARTLSVVVILASAAGLAHVVWTRYVPSPTFCLLLLVLDVVCGSVLLATAVDAVSMATKAIETAPALTTFEHRMESHWNTSALSSERPRNPMPSVSTYPVAGAAIFATTYCVSEGYRVCSEFPLVQTILSPGLWSDANVTAEIARNLSTLPATFVNVTVTASTTLERFCATAQLPPVPSLFNMTSPKDMRTPAYLFSRDLWRLCDGCATLANVTTTHQKLQAWIHNVCPMTRPKAYYGAFCIGAADCLAREARTGYVCAPMQALQYTDPAFNECFGHTLMSAARPYDVAVAAASSILLLVSVLLAVRLWVLRRLENQLRALRDAMPTTTPQPNNWVF